MALIDALLTPTTLIIIALLTGLEVIVLMRWFARRQDGRNVWITLGNGAAGMCLMGALASEMADRSVLLTAACLLGALVAHVTEVWLRLR